MTTIKTIAARCGVSAATVSKALNGAPDVSPVTAERIRRAADEMGYMPNAAARALKTSRSYSFGILLTENVERCLPHDYFIRVLTSFKKHAEALGYDAVLMGDRLGEREIDCAEHARYRNCDGVLIIAGAETDINEIGSILDSDIPTVCVDYVFADASAVISDNERGIRDLVSFIYKQGHRRIAFVHGEDLIVTRRRLTSFLETCSSLGVHVPKEYLVPAVYLNVAAAEEATRRLLSLTVPPTCIIYPDDVACIGGINEIRRMGLSVPEDVSVAGYDGISFTQLAHPRLTTIRQNAEAMGATAAEELAAAVRLGDVYKPRTILISGELLEGETVLPPPSLAASG